MVFLEALFTRGRPFTYLIIGINLGVFFLMWLAGGMGVMGGNDELVVAFGAKVNSLIDAQHHYWRLVTCMFIHIGLLHLLMNNYALWILGQQIEQIYGSARYVFLYLASGLVGSLFSYTFKPLAASAGASGAIFGLFGVMAAFAFRYRREIPRALSRDIIRRIIPVIAINLLFGFLVSVVDNSAHIGGLIAGAALTLVVPYKRPGEERTGALWRMLQVASLAVIAISFVLAFRSYDGPRPSLANLAVSPESRSRPFDEANSRLVDSMNLFTELLGEKDERADLGPARQAADSGINTLKPLLEGDKSGTQRERRLMEVLTEQRAIIERFEKERPRNWSQATADETALIDRAKRYALIRHD